MGLTRENRKCLQASLFAWWTLPSQTSQRAASSAGQKTVAFSLPQTSHQIFISMFLTQKYPEEETEETLWKNEIWFEFWERERESDYSCDLVGKTDKGVMGVWGSINLNLNGQVFFFLLTWDLRETSGEKIEFRISCKLLNRRKLLGWFIGGILYLIYIQCLIISLYYMNRNKFFLFLLYEIRLVRNISVMHVNLV